MICRSTRPRTTSSTSTSATAILFGRITGTPVSIPKNGNRSGPTKSKHDRREQEKHTDQSNRKATTREQLRIRRSCHVKLRIGEPDTMTVDPGTISKHGPTMANAADTIASVCGLGTSDPGGRAIENLISTKTITRSIVSLTSFSEFDRLAIDR